jgi:hypothetical protein
LHHRYHRRPQRSRGRIGRRQEGVLTEVGKTLCRLDLREPKDVLHLIQGAS